MRLFRRTRVLTLGPNDYLVAQVPDRLSQEQLAQLHRRLSRVAGFERTLVIGGDIKLSVLKRLP